MAMLAVVVVAFAGSFVNECDTVPSNWQRKSG